jgi:[protein-PII] uridylyltransferase
MTAASRLRSNVLAVRQRLVEERQHLREQHDRGLEGGRVCARYTSLVDAAVTELYDAFLNELTEPQAAELRERAALVAHGGYGRRQQAPYSDVDLMVLYSGRPDELVKQLAARLTQDISDLNIALGHSFRSPAEAVQRARGDAQIGTSLLESRLLVGNGDVYKQFRAAMDAMIEKRSAALARAFIAERRKERLQYGETVYILEPNVKRSRGGLRDIHLLRWLWRIKAGEADPDRLHDLGLLSKFDYRRLISAQNFLLRVRNEMHFHAGEPTDGLGRAEQLRLADYFRYAGKEGLLPVEQFMRDYFHHTNHVWHLAHRLSELMQPPSRVSRVLEPMLGRKTEDDYLVSRHEVSATPRAIARLAQGSAEALRLVDLARQEGKRIAQDTWHFVYRTAPQYSSQPNAPLNAAFMKLLANPRRLGELLRRLHELGVLEKIVPDFAHARSLLQFNQYHKFTVDEHCIRAVEEATQFAERQDVVGELYRQLPQKALLHLALLLHDLGKGFDEDHSEVGRRIADEIGRRFELPGHDRKTLAFLVHKHLLMSHLALKYDTTQHELVRKFVDDVHAQDRLDLLFLVTCADLAAVGPGVLNSWKIEVLTDLYLAASRQLGSKGVVAIEQQRDRQRTAAWQQLTPDEQGDPWFDEQLAVLPESYLLRWPAPAVADALRRMRNLPSRAGVAWANYQLETDTIEFVAGIDEGVGRAIFSSMAGALTSNRMQILAAETNTLAQGLLLLRYVAHEPETPGEPSPERLDAIAKSLVDSIDSDTVPSFPKILGREQKAAGAALTNQPNRVRINQELSDQCAVLEVFTIDRRGLLYSLARTLHDLGLVIRFAKIGTYLDQVVDVFYVTERDGTKPRGDERLAKIRDGLAKVIAPMQVP